MYERPTIDLDRIAQLIGDPGPARPWEADATLLWDGEDLEREDKPGREASKPEWDRESLTLSIGNVACRKFTKRLNNQITILESLEAAGWPKESIPNPLRDEPRLRQTVKDFNKACVPGSPFRLKQDHDRVGWSLK
jgi:hypothetical protein